LSIYGSGVRTVRITRIRGSLAYYTARELADEGIDEAALARFADGVGAVRYQIKAVDLTVAAPKSVSVAWALAEGEARERIAGAHERAVATLLQELRALEWSRPGQDGVERPLVGVESLAVRHHLSRAGDPHLHAHVLIANRGEVEGRPRALDHWRLASHLPAYELLYRVALSAELAPLGLRLEGVGLGPWVLAGQERGLAELFSKRRREVLAEAWSAGARARQLATLRTRAHKVTHDLEERTARWREEARRHELTVPLETRGEWPRVPDPLLAELVRSVADGARSVAEAWDVALSRALGEGAARGLARGEEVWVGRRRLARDGTLLAAYRSLPLEERLARAGGVLRLLEAPRELGGLLDELARTACAPGQRLELRGSSAREEQLVAGVGQYRDGPRAPVVVLDANAIAPSELAALTRDRGAMVRVEPPARGADGGEVGVVAVIPCVEGGQMVVAEQASALWRAFVEAGAVALAAHGSQLVVPNEVVARRLRRELASSHPELVVIPGRALLRGEIARCRDGTLGRVVGSRDGAALVESEAGIAAHAPTELAALGIVVEGTERSTDHVLSFGSAKGRFLPGDQVFAFQGGVEELVRALGGRGRVEIADAVHHELQARRLELLARSDLPEGREGLKALRTATRHLFTSYLLARELGLDDRGGLERSLPALGIRGAEPERTREGSSRALLREAALAW